MRQGCIRKTRGPDGGQDRPGHDRRYANQPGKAAGRIRLAAADQPVGQGKSRDEAIARLRLAVQSLEDACRDDPDISTAPVPIKAPHEFLTVGHTEPAPSPMN